MSGSIWNPNGWINTASAAFMSFLQRGLGAIIRTVEQKLQDTVHVADFGADPTGVVSSSLAIQAAIDSRSGGLSIEFDSEGIYKLDKLVNFLPAVYPVRAGNNFGDQPCLVIYNKRNITLRGNGAKLVVSAHAQGVIDILQSKNIRIEGFVVEGPANFPPLDGTTGRGEKGTVTEGYYDAASVANGEPRNNSRITSGFSTGGYGGAFPQLAGGVAATWGTWTGGGYIANTGSFVTIDDGSNFVFVERNEVYGFNGDAVTVSSTITESYGWAAPYDVYIDKNNFHDNYNSGVTYHNVTALFITNNKIINNGHPSASLAHTVIDPGYGIASNNGTAPLNININKNHFIGNKRKGIDAHSIDTAIITDNIIKQSGYGIMCVNGSLGSIRNLVISNNQIFDIAYPPSAQATGIYVEKNITGAVGSSGKVSITGNIVQNVGVPPGSTALFPGTTPKGIAILINDTLDDNIISSNIVTNDTYFGFIGICVGSAGASVVPSVVVGNKIKGKFNIGLLDAAPGGAENSIIANNINLVSTSPTYVAAQTALQSVNDRCLSGNNITVAAGLAYANSSVIGTKVCINVDIAAGVITTTYGSNSSKYVSAVASYANGLQITLGSGLIAQVVNITQTGAARPIKTAGAIPLDYIYAVTPLSNLVQVGFQVAGVNYPAAQVTGKFIFELSI